MSVALSLAASGLKPAASRRSKIKFSLMAKIRTKTALISAILMILLLSLAVFYFAQVNVLIAKGYQINDLKQDLARRQKRNEQLEFQATELQSQQLMAKKVEALGLVKVTAVDYLSFDGNDLAVR